MSVLKKLMIPPKLQYASAETVQILSIILHHDYCQPHGEQGMDTYSTLSGCLFSDDYTEGRLCARSHLAAMLSRGVIEISRGCLHPSVEINAWITNKNPLLVPNLTDEMVRDYLSKQLVAAKNERKARQERQQNSQKPAMPILTPQSLFQQLRQIVIGQDDACRVLATRGWLHLKRAELLKQGKRVGANECLFFISQFSGVGKTFLAENYGRLCSLPFTSFSATDATAVGYVGLDLVEDSIKALIRSAGDPRESSTLERARLGGIIFYDEFTKKRAFTNDNGRDISGSGVQQEVLRLMEGCKVILGNRRVDRDVTPIEFDSSGVMFVFGGYVHGFEKIIGKIQGQGIGFREAHKNGTKDRYLSDALIEYGFLPEFVNRLSKVVIFKRLSRENMVSIANSPNGVMASYQQLLAPQGLSFRIEDDGLRYMAGVSVDTGMMARGLRLIVGALVEDLVFSGAKGDVLLSLKEVKRAVEQVTTVEGMTQP